MFSKVSPARKGFSLYFVKSDILSIDALSAPMNGGIGCAIRNGFGCLASKFIATQCSRTKLIITADCTLFQTCGIVWITGSMLRSIRKKTMINRRRKRKYPEFIGLSSLIENGHVQRPWVTSPHCPYAMIFVFISCIWMQQHRQIAWMLGLTCILRIKLLEIWITSILWKPRSDEWIITEWDENRPFATDERSANQRWITNIMIVDHA